jgi:cytochrome c oxidase subunit 2
MLNLLSIYLKGTFVFNPVLNDAPEPLQISFQDSASPGLEGIIDLHDSIFFYLIVISVGVFWILGSTLINFNSHKSPIIYKYLNHGTLIELVWTITPALVLIAIAFPSFKLLYMLDEVISPAMTVKVSGHQWYWSYEYSDFIKEGNEAIEFDSYMVPESDLELGQLRLLDVDNRLVIPIDTHIRFVVTGTDVLHDFAVPALGIKIDAVPGRLNQTSAIAKRAGIFYGQCSEICGTYHGFMPSVVEGVETENFLVWLDNAGIFVFFGSLKNNLKNFINNILSRLANTRVGKGTKLGWNTPTLPEHIIKLQSHFLIRIFRVLGGISLLLVLSKKVQLLPNILLYIVVLIVFLFLIYHMYITIHRVIHIRYLFKSGKLDVRNSPLSKLASMFARVAVCLKGTCDAAVPIGTGLGIFAGFDMVLEASGNEAIFIPAMGSAVGKAIGSKTALELYIEKKAIYRELATVEKLNQVWKENLEFTKLFSESDLFTDEDRKVIAESFIHDKNKIVARRGGADG